MRKPAIPRVNTGDAVSRQAFEAIKQTLDQITGQASNVERLPELPDDATLSEAIARINEITRRLQ